MLNNIQDSRIPANQLNLERLKFLMMQIRIKRATSGATTNDRLKFNRTFVG